MDKDLRSQVREALRTLQRTRGISPSRRELAIAHLSRMNLSPHEKAVVIPVLRSTLAGSNPVLRQGPNWRVARNVWLVVSVLLAPIYTGKAIGEVQRLPNSWIDYIGATLV